MSSTTAAFFKELEEVLDEVSKMDTHCLLSNLRLVVTGDNGGKQQEAEIEKQSEAEATTSTSAGGKLKFKFNQPAPPAPPKPKTNLVTLTTIMEIVADRKKSTTDESGCIELLNEVREYLKAILNYLRGSILEVVTDWECDKCGKNVETARKVPRTVALHQEILRLERVLDRILFPLRGSLLASFLPATHKKAIMEKGCVLHCLDRLCAHMLDKDKANHLSVFVAHPYQSFEDGATCSKYQRMVGNSGHMMYLHKAYGQVRETPDEKGGDSQTRVQHCLTAIRLNSAKFSNSTSDFTKAAEGLTKEFNKLCSKLVRHDDLHKEMREWNATNPTTKDSFRHKSCIKPEYMEEIETICRSPHHVLEDREIKPSVKDTEEKVDEDDDDDDDAGKPTTKKSKKNSKKPSLKKGANRGVDEEEQLAEEGPAKLVKKKSKTETTAQEEEPDDEADAVPKPSKKSLKFSLTGGGKKSLSDRQTTRQDQKDDDAQRPPKALRKEGQKGGVTAGRQASTGVGDTKKAEKKKSTGRKAPTVVDEESSDSESVTSPSESASSELESDESSSEESSSTEAKRPRKVKTRRNLPAKGKSGKLKQKQEAEDSSGDDERDDDEPEVYDDLMEEAQAINRKMYELDNLMAADRADWQATREMQQRAREREGRRGDLITYSPAQTEKAKQYYETYLKLHERLKAALIRLSNQKTTQRR